MSSSEVQMTRQMQAMLCHSFYKLDQNPCSHLLVDDCSLFVLYV